LGGKLHEWLGVIRRTDARVDQDTRNLYAIAEIDQPFESQQGFSSSPLLPGLFVEAEIEGRPIDGLTHLPRSAMQNDDTLRVVDSESTIRERLVRSLYRDSLNVWIPDLVAGERIVVSNSALLQVGTAVTAVLTEQLAFEGF
ncbi:MAG: efflux transporter periplasmic adaptor subunit, partial [Pseudomonadota bacterium]